MNNGGPAFPVYPRNDGYTAREIQNACGMTLRDYFAAHSEGPDADCTAEFAADCLGWPRPDFKPEQRREWFLWWRDVEAAWKKASADALLKVMEQ